MIRANPAEPRVIEFRFVSSDGVPIVCRHWEGRVRPHAIVQIAHGMGEHMGRYSSTIKALTSAGFAVYSNDHRGHGLTARSREYLGDFGDGGFELLVADVWRLSEIAKKENPELPLFLLGHSMGSFAAQQYILNHSKDIDGLILSGSGVLEGLVQAVAAAWAQGFNPLNDGLKPTRTPFCWLSRDEQVGEAFMADPLCFAQLKPRSLASLRQAADKLADPAALCRIRSDLPVYLFWGSEDPVEQKFEGVKILMDRYCKAGLRDVSRVVYEGGRHEMLNEINAGEVRARLLCWIFSILGGAASDIPSFTQTAGSGFGKPEKRLAVTIL